MSYRGLGPQYLNINLSPGPVIRWSRGPVLPSLYYPPSTTPGTPLLHRSPAWSTYPPTYPQTEKSRGAHYFRVTLLAGSFTGSRDYDRGLLAVRPWLHSSYGTSKEPTLVPSGYPIFPKRPTLLDVRSPQGLNTLILRLRLRLRWVPEASLRLSLRPRLRPV